MRWRLGRLRMPVVYACSAHERANPFNCWHLTDRIAQSTVVAVAGGRHGETGARLRDAIAAGGRPRRSEGRHSSAEERAHGPRDDALDCGQQGGNRVDLSAVDRSLLRYVSGDLNDAFQRFPKFSGSTLGSPNASEMSTVDCPVSSKRLRHLSQATKSSRRTMYKLAFATSSRSLS